MDQRNARPAAASSSATVYVVLLVLAVVIVAAGAYLVTRGQGWTMFAAGCASLVLVLTTWPLARAMEAAARCTTTSTDASVAALSRQLDRVVEQLRQIHDLEQLSDRAKSVAFREKDSEALRAAIREELGRQNFDGAIVLADEMERAFGYKLEADAFREEITTRRGEIHRRQIAEAIAVVDRHIRAEEWEDATAEARRLATIYPDAPQVKVLPAEIEGRRGARKRAMVDEFHAQYGRKDVDGAIATLKRLDTYLTPAEAEAMQETVRQLFKDKLNNLRTQFTVAVQDKHSREAIRLGEEIMRDFPNSRLAQEVGDIMEALKHRASEEEPAGASA